MPAESTQETYARHWRQFEVWLAEHGLDAEAFDALPPRDQDATSARYARARFDAGLAPATIRQFGCAARKRARMLYLPPPTGPLYDDELSDIGRKGRGRGNGKVAGLSERDVHRAAEAARAEGSPIGYRDAAVLLTGFTALLRISELANLRLADFDDGPPPKIQIRHSKTDQTGRGTPQAVSDAAGEAVAAWLRYRGPPTPPGSGSPRRPERPPARRLRGPRGRRHAGRS